MFFSFSLTAQEKKSKTDVYFVDSTFVYKKNKTINAQAIDPIDPPIAEIHYYSPFIIEAQDLTKSSTLELQNSSYKKWSMSNTIIDNALNFSYNGSTKASLNTLGYMGIATTFPKTTLDVRGTITAIKYSTFPNVYNAYTTTLAINSALSTYKVVMLEPGQTYQISGTINIADGQELHIPTSTIIEYNCTTCSSTSKAILMTGGKISGGGTLKASKGSTWYIKASGIQIEGSRAKVELGSIQGFKKGIFLYGTGKGTQYSKINLGQIVNCFYAVYLDAVNLDTKDGWVNQNFIHVDNITIYSNYDNTGTWGIYIDSHTGNSPNMNVFSGSIEGTNSGIYLTGSYNSIEQLRIEIPFNYKWIEVSTTSAGYIAYYNRIYGGYGTFDEGKNLIFNSNYSDKEKRQALQGFGARGIGVYIAPSNYSAGYEGRELYVDGDAYIGGFINWLSDINQKEDIEIIDNTLSKLKQINGITFKFKKDSSQTSPRTNYGLIAQEVQNVFPDLVEPIDSSLTLNYIGIIPVLVEAVKEQQSSIEQTDSVINLQSIQIEELNNTVTNLLGELDKIKKKLENDDNEQKQTQSKPTISRNILHNKLGTLKQNVPNPFSDYTQIEYEIFTSFNYAYIAIFDLNGQLQNTYSIDEKENGSIQIEANTLSKGMYIYSLIIDGQEIESKKMIINH